MATSPASRALERLADRLNQEHPRKLAARLAACGEFGSGIRCDALTCGRTKVAVPRYCRLRTCPTCAPRDSVRLRRRWGRRFRYVAERQVRPGHKPMMVTLTFKTLPAVLRRLERTESGVLFAPWIRWSFGVALQFLRELYPGEVQPADPDAPKRARRRRLGAGGLATFEVGAGGHAHAHALVYGDWYDKRKKLTPEWRERAAYRGCAVCGSFRAGRAEAPCPDAACARHGQPLELVESFILDVKEARGADPLEYVLKYITKAGAGELPMRAAELEIALGSIHRVRAWGSLMGIPESELEAAGYAEPEREPLTCEHCNGRLHREETMATTMRTLRASRYEPVDDYRRRTRKRVTSRDPPGEEADPRPVALAS